MRGDVLVLGAYGRLGRILRCYWTEGAAAWQSRSAAPGYLSFDPLASPSELQQAAQGRRAILCLAGVTPAEAARSGAPMRRNIDVARAAIAAAGAAGVPRVLLASSAAVYGQAAGLLEETRDCDPVSDYGKSKLEMERLGTELGADLGVEVCSLRIGNVAGADVILGGWRDGFALDTLPDGTTPRRSYIGPNSLARAVHGLLDAPRLPEAVNVAAPGAVEMGALLDAAGLGWQPRAAGPEVIAEVALATARLAQHIVLAADAGTPEGLVSEWQDYRNRTRHEI
ncbi:NAD-dependent epimerase/dehydratase family protein [Sulfitobacter sp. D35]|uniref:NAD-dependent epimerase/dehydratase family protein n=1 Tax=Sulfitobacter sp. D35 TaxID=3083252 RepID=UPI00296EFA57|nr:NAD-dependent epimerase/dehydratase family protein [Sulfitobacter sp. D35]MDW4498211.1 NAD-dependent epimerase/dehydratase family protein [Sulfitobacter sp. D35]